ncbi:TPA: hypothetical protein PNN87_003275 [Legionella pneumophila]|nr:hypothetical protein [Legionella pneumophila]HDI4386778.1 hypothetical protein [Legionella pneumophila]HDI4390016.1 hypothetical protein [Legionella pneumophila]
MFEEVAGEEGDAADAASQSSPSRIIFHPATGVTADAVGVNSQIKLPTSATLFCLFFTD